MTNLKLPTFVLIAMHCATGVHGQQAESCILYQTSNTSTLEYQLKADQNNYVTINHLFNKTQATNIFNEENICVLQLMNSISSSTNNGCMTLPYRGDYTTMGFRKGEDGVLFVNEKSENEIRLNVKASSLRVKSSKRVNVAFDCPGNCFQFRDALIHAKPKGTDTRISLKIYGLIEDQQKATANDSKLRLLRGENWSQQSWWELSDWNLSALKSNEWIQFDINAIFTHSIEYHPLNYFFNVSVKTPKGDPIHTKKEIYVETKNFYIDFNSTRGMRWAIHCQPNEPTQSNASNDTTPTQVNFPDGIIKMEYFFTLAAVCGILVIANVILCCIIRSKGKQQRQKHTAQTNALSETNTAEPGIVGREGNGQGAVYDYIDIQDLHNYLAKASSENNLADSHVDAKVMQTATSHTSINSTYGYNNDVANCNTDSGHLRKFSHTSENSLYGCH